VRVQLDVVDEAAFSRTSAQLAQTAAVGKHKHDLWNVIDYCRVTLFPHVDTTKTGGGKRADSHAPNNIVIVLYSCTDDQYATIV
jgi:hypothetical protein